MIQENFHFNIISSSPEETIKAGEELVFFLHRGSIVALYGALGAGKTYFTKGIAKALSIEEEITSPTYTIISEYEGLLKKEKISFYHIDAYRLLGDDDFTNIGGEELLYGNGISVIEWSERFSNSIPENAISIEIEVIEYNKRRITTRDKK